MIPVEADAVVLYVEDDGVLHVRERDRYVGRRGVFAGVRERLLARAEQSYLVLLWQRPLPTRDRERGGRAGLARPASGESLQGLR